MNAAYLNAAKWSIVYPSNERKEPPIMDITHFSTYHRWCHAARSRHAPREFSPRRTSLPEEPYATALQWANAAKTARLHLETYLMKLAVLAFTLAPISIRYCTSSVTPGVWQRICRGLLPSRSCTLTFAPSAWEKKKESEFPTMVDQEFTNSL